MPQARPRQPRPDLTQKAYMAIRQMLFYNEIQPGQKIKYKDLATRIGVSMTPVIQALKWLEFMNIVRREAHRGYYINEVSLKEVTEVYDTRLLLEVALVPDIIRNVGKDDVKRLKTAFADYTDAVEQGNYYKRMMTDMRFHMGLAAISQCHIKVKMLQELFDILLLRYSRDLFFLSVTDTSPPEHARILAAVEKKDKGELEAALRFHVGTVRHHIITGMERLVVDEKESF